MSYKFSLFNVFKKKENSLFVFNTFTKALIKLEGYNRNSFILSNIKEFDDTILTTLIKNGFIVDNEVDEIAVLEKFYNKFNVQSEYLYLTLLPTFNCNFDCPYCFEGVKGNSKINIDLLKKFSAIKFNNWKHVHIALFGGEPLLEIELLRDYYKFLIKDSEEKGYEFSTGIATNGFLLTDENLKILVEEFKCKNIQITVDGFRNSHDITRALVDGTPTYDVIIKNLKSILNSKYKNINLSLRINLLNNSLDEINSLLDEFSLCEKKLFDVYFRPIYNTKTFKCKNENTKNIEEFYKIAIEKGFIIRFAQNIKFCYCEADGGLEQITICPDMSIWKCINDLSFKEANIGKIDNDGCEIYDYLKVEKWKTNSPFFDKTCRACKYLPLCWGGCPLNFHKNKKRTCFLEKGFDFSMLLINI